MIMPGPPLTPEITGPASHGGQSSFPLYSRKSVTLWPIRRRYFSGRKLFIEYALNPYAMKFLFALSPRNEEREAKRCGRVERNGRANAAGGLSATGGQTSRGVKRRGGSMGGPSGGGYRLG